MNAPFDLFALDKDTRASTDAFVIVNVSPVPFFLLHCVVEEAIVQTTGVGSSSDTDAVEIGMRRK